jgi:hypothetical protein
VATCDKIKRMLPDFRSSEFDETLLTVWRQVLVDSGTRVLLGGDTHPVRRTAKHKLAQVDFEFEGTPIRGLEQNPQTKSRWAQQARKGSKVMQFLSAGRYVAVAYDGKITHYGDKKT